MIQLGKCVGGVVGVCGWVADTNYLYPARTMLSNVIFSGSYRNITHDGQPKPCLAACTSQSYPLTLSEASFPVQSTFKLGRTFCSLVKKIERSCQDQMKVSLELVYPDICQMVQAVQENNACNPYYTPETVKGWEANRKEEFANMVMKYTKENLVKINIYMKEPYATKFVINEEYTKYVYSDHLIVTLVLNCKYLQFLLHQQHWWTSWPLSRL